MKSEFLRGIFKLCLGTSLVSCLTAAQLEWTNVAGGNWSVPTNWSPNQVPTGDDDALITTAGTYTVTVDTDAVVKSLTLGGPAGSQALQISGSLLLMGGLTVIHSNGLMSLFGGRIGGDGDISLEGIFNVFGGSLAGSGVLSIGMPGELLLAGNINVGGRPIQNAGQMTWTSGNVSNVSLISISSDGLFDILVSGDNTLSGNQSLTNSGLVRRRVGNGVAGFDLPFHNAGTVEVQTGRLLMLRGGTHAGSFVVRTNATLQVGLFANHVSDFASASSVTGGGHVTFQNSSVGVSGLFDVRGMTTINGGTVNVSTGYILSNSPITLLAGTVNFNSGRMLWPSTLTVSGGVLAGNDSMTVTGLVRLTGGILQSSGVINANGGISILQPADVTMFSGTLNNAALATMTGNLRLWSNSVLNNLPGATFHYSSGFLGQPGIPGRFNNAGLLRMTGNFRGIAVPFYNDGLVDIESGTFYISEGGVHSGTFQVVTNAVLRFDPGFRGAPHTLLSSSEISGDGSVWFQTSVNAAGLLAVTGAIVVTGGTNNFTGVYANAKSLEVSGGRANFNTGSPILPQGLTVSGGILSGDDPIIVNGPMIWTGGTLSGSRAVDAHGGLTIGGSTLLLDGRLLSNTGVANWNGGFIFTGGGSIIYNAPSGIFNIGFDGQTFAGFGGSRSFVNAGVLRKIAGNGTTRISDAMLNNGTIEVETGSLVFEGGFLQTTGVTRLNGGDIAANAPLEIQGGILSGSGTIGASVVNAGQLAPGASAGLLRITGDYTQTSSGRLSVELGGSIAGTSFDQLQISGSASLNGTLNVSTINGFRPAFGDSFRVLTFASRTGDFATFNDLTGSELNRIYDGTGLILASSNSSPFLVISREGADLAVSWSTNLSGYVLQSSSNLLSANWTNVSSSNNKATISPNQPKTFFRLRSP